MKKIKFAFLSLVMVLFVFTSCENNDAIVDEQQTTTESESITTALNQLARQYDDSGNLEVSSNSTGNVVLDFCFNFVYPLNLSYNNGTAVTVNDLDELVDVIINSTEALYVDGIVFPFDVEALNEDTNTIEVSTINNEDEFASLIENCAFDVEVPCDCYEVYEPVCVEITTPDGNTFTVSYPNACYAECDGFTEDDFVDGCFDNYNPIGGLDCFELNFPLSITINDGAETITVNSMEELRDAVYSAYGFDFVYPISATLEDGGEIVTINSVEDLAMLIETCYGEVSNCEECYNQPIEPVCVEVTAPTGETEILTYENACFALCDGYTENDFVDCPSAPLCSIDEMNALLFGCPWILVTTSEVIYTYVFNADNTVTITGGGVSYTSSWTLVTGVPGTNTPNVVMITGDNTMFNNQWIFVSCDADNLVVTSDDPNVGRIEQICD